MNKSSFKNRVKELEFLSECYQKGSPKLIILYGRRRVGKTELLREFLKKHKGIYLLARQESETEQLKKMSSQIAEFYGDKVLTINPFQNWDAFFIYLAEKPRIPIVIDEFPYMVEASKNIPSILQDYWDNSFSKKNSFIILCGSSIQMMENLLGKKSPIYGRRTEQILLEPLKFRDACLFLPKKMSIKERVLYFSILGGMPAYLLEFDYKKSIKENIAENIIRKNKFLYQDVLFSLREELNEPRNYFSILYAIAKGNTKLGEIVNDTGLEKSFVTKYISVLIGLQLVERRVPITEKNRTKSRKGIYLLKDNFFKFWFKFVFENQEYIEQEKQEKLLDEKIMPEIHGFAGRIFEDVALSEISVNKKYKDYFFGRWWDREYEVDIVGVDRKNKKILIGEVKFKKLNEKEVQEIKSHLKEIVQRINTFTFEEHFLIVCLGYDGKVDGIEVVSLE
ncbi:MAG: ATP-binding protein [bacterium]|nr:ATP-binding protein [bacterium]